MESLNQELYLVFHDDQSKSTIGSPQSSDVGGCHLSGKEQVSKYIKDIGFSNSRYLLKTKKVTNHIINVPR